MTQSPTNVSTPYAPLPVRARGTLEIFDTAFKLFRRYAGVLLAWSFLASVINVIPIFGTFIYLFTMPLAYGAVSCATAAAVRGQSITFKQVWGFTKPRYGALLGVLILAWILLGIAVIALVFVGSLATFGIVALVSSYGTAATVFAWIVGFLVVLVGGSFFLALTLGWFNLAPVIACLEDANRGANALSRAGALMSGNWRKASGVAVISSLMGSAIFLIVGGFLMFFFYGGIDKFLGADFGNSLFSSIAWTGFNAIFIGAWTPIQAIVGAVFYLDLRTRKEALDLEWTNYAAKPELTPEQIASGQFNAPTASNPAMGASPYSPASFSGVAPEVPQTPIYMGDAPTEQSVSPTGVSLPTAPIAADSFANFASQVEMQPAQAPAVTETFSAPLAPQPPLGGEGPPTPPTLELTKPAVPVEVAPSPTATAEYGFSSPSAAQDTEPSLLTPPPIPTEPITETAPIVPPPTPPVSESPAPSNETSSFSPPPRFQRTTSDDDDFPSSFGGGAR